MGTLEVTVAQRRELIEYKHQELSVVQQCILLGLCRSGLYYIPKGRISIDELAVKAEIDRTYTKMPYYGVARMTEHLKQKGFVVGRSEERRVGKECRL